MSSQGNYATRCAALSLLGRKFRGSTRESPQYAMTGGDIGSCKPCTGCFTAYSIFVGHIIFDLVNKLLRLAEFNVKFS